MPGDGGSFSSCQRSRHAPSTLPGWRANEAGAPSQTEPMLAVGVSLAVGPVLLLGGEPQQAHCGQPARTYTGGTPLSMTTQPGTSSEFTRRRRGGLAPGRPRRCQAANSCRGARTAWVGGRVACPSVIRTKEGRVDFQPRHQRRGAWTGGVEFPKGGRPVDC